jgi:SAM-dependent methyltransferase
VVVCVDCGFSFLNPRWTKERYDLFYASEYDKYYRPEVISQNDDRYKFVPAGQIVERLRRQNLLRHFNRVLDLGSGMGHALTYLRNEHEPNAQYDALEPSPACQTHLLSSGFGYVGADVYGHWGEQLKNTYGFVIMRHVLEHFHEPLAVLRKVRSVLRDDGLLYVAVPDAMHPTKPLRSHFFRVVHINYFTRRSLESMLGLAGLEVIHIMEGDDLARNEVFAVCRKGPTLPHRPDKSEAETQLALYRNAGRLDTWYELKSWGISLLRRLGLIK